MLQLSNNLPNVLIGELDMTTDYILIADIKKQIAEKFGINLHFHDTCGSGMYFSLDVRNDEIAMFIQQYFATKHLNVIVSENGLNFTVQSN